MDIRRITPIFWASPQITPADIVFLAGIPIRTIINARPDHEASGQPASAEIATAAKGLGLGYQHVPVKSSEIRDEDVAQFSATLAASDAPILGFCRTGTRAVMLWALAQADHVASNDLIQAAGRHGYDITTLKPRLDERRGGRGSQS